MSTSEIIGIAIGAIMLVFVILTWAGIVPRKVSKTNQEKRLLPIDPLDIGFLVIMGAVAYLAIVGKEIPPYLYVFVTLGFIVIGTKSLIKKL